MAVGDITGAPGESFDAGKLGLYTIEEENGMINEMIYLGGGYQFDSGNIDDFKEVF